MLTPAGTSIILGLGRLGRDSDDEWSAGEVHAATFPHVVGSGLNTVLETIGNTRLVRLHRCVPANGAELWLKLEYRNPTGSMKDRMGLAMIEGAERDGLISPGDTIVEYTGGRSG